MPDEPNEDLQVITLEEATEKSGIPTSTLRDAARSGKLKTLRPEPPWLTTMQDVKDFKEHRYIPRPRNVKK